MAHQILLLGEAAGTPGHVRSVKAALPADADATTARAQLADVRLGGRWRTAELWSGEEVDGVWQAGSMLAMKSAPDPAAAP